MQLLNPASIISASLAEEEESTLLLAPEDIRAKIRFLQPSVTEHSLRSAVVVHGHKPALPDPLLKQRVYNAVLDFIMPSRVHLALHDRYDRLIFTGGLRKLSEQHSLQSQLGLEYLREFIHDIVIRRIVEGELERRQSAIRPDLVESVGGGKEVVLDSEKHVLHLWKGNSFYSEMEEMWHNICTLRHVTSYTEHVLEREARILRSSTYALEKLGYEPATHTYAKTDTYFPYNSKPHSAHSTTTEFAGANGAKLTHTVVGSSLPPLHLAQRLDVYWYEGISSALYRLPEKRLAKIIENRRKNA